MSEKEAMENRASSNPTVEEEITEVSTSPQEADAPVEEEAPSVEVLTAKLAEAEEKAAQHWDALLRQKADIENQQKRLQRDIDSARKFALERFANELLAVKDSMEMGFDAASQEGVAIQTVQEGMSLTLKQLSSVLEKFDITEINPLQEKFNPEWHEAMAMQPVPDVEEGTVIMVHQKGYQLNGRLLRPARVIVAKAIT